MSRQSGEKWSSIAQLAAEYKTIAQTAQHERFATAVAASRLDSNPTAAVVGAESFGSLIAPLRRTEANGRHPGQLLSRAVQASGLGDASDPAARSAATTMTTSAPVSGMADGGGVLGPARMSIHGADDTVAELMRGYVPSRQRSPGVVRSHARVADVEPVT